ncbi:MAG: flagellar biosynthesis protein FlhA [Halothiobacillus sp. 14-56-357]|jgi:flagellar biosynthesis protein FlhA|uniref:flagellar biosynthesis protein FlhA n=1 Tax=Halothiobacillus sp. 15-55-196 TaxID=1970382 RepID=UPI000BD810DF|nr:flagellar biosynthesis protein FlhA [Halothiobacillus sp. 15-55-196]OZB37783.1 MAG: flagellar biosynthesis protein FlhA [Halothiobacillus sp. 15-55-196]OZB57426.1 MAG: flagellar biosynthesis protein FlhA [Halothiobacillus sp. 14-56-357]
MKALLASLDWRSAGQGIRSYRGQGIGPPLIIVMLLAMVVVPLPPLALDALFTFNITLSIVILMVTIYVMRPLDFAVFPTVILMATLLRLALNVASTRVVLLHGQNGPEAAGHVIGSFGEFVIGGNYAVGIVVFIILMLINFVVVTKGAGRVSEVTARFTLDALPGKQMAIDADLNAGIINQEQAKLRREEVASEADFYGSMDGASKFVRGDAVAGILIVFINVFGGLLIGVLQHGMPFGEAAQTYVLLTIGDGLVATIPSLLISTATAIIVTRVASSQDMGKQVQTQMFSDPRVLGVAAGLMAGLGVIPGMPNVAFLTLAALAGTGAYLIARKKQEKAQLEAQQQAVPDKKPELKELTWDDVPPVDVIGLEVGYGLIPLVDRNQGGQLMPRIKGVRKKISQDLGFLVSAVHIRDNLDLKPGEYRISINGVPMGVAEIYADRDMAINPGQVSGPIAGIKTIDPAFGLEAYWIERNTKEHAQAMGYTVVDPATVIATHLSQLLTENAADLFGYEEAQQLIDTLKEGAPKLVEDLVPKTLGMTTIVQVLRNLLEERLPIRDIRTIAETLARHGQHTQDVSQLTEVVRIALGRMIVQHINGLSPTLPVITLDPQLEQLLLNSTQRPNGGQDGTPGIEPGLAERLHQSLREAAEKQEQVGQPSILLVAPQIRSWLARMVRYSIRQLHVLSYNEIPDNKDIKVVASVGNQRAVA